MGCPLCPAGVPTSTVTARNFDEPLAPPTPAEAEQLPRVSAAKPRRLRRWAAATTSSTTACLLLLTAFAAVLHFMHLDRPALWIDEAATFRRVSGDYRQMIGELRRDGFGPLHYQAYWLLARYELLTPAVMRWIPATAGTLFVPAIYVLARQLFGRRTALVAALLAACNACVFVYSRDAKMYMHGWLFVTVHLAGLLWWLRTGRSTAWLVWVAGGVAMGGTLTVAVVLLAIEPLLVLTARRVTWASGPLFVLGLLVVAAGPVGHFTYFTDYLQQDQPRGIQWVEQRNRDAGGWMLVLDSASCFLGGFQWLSETWMGNVPPAITRAKTWAAWGIGAILLIGALPWPWRWRADGRQPVADLPPLAKLDPEPPARAGRHVEPARVHGAPAVRVTDRRGVEPQPAWRAWLWLGFLIVVPVYGFYCRSVDGFVPPLPASWLGASQSAASQSWLEAIEAWTRQLTGVRFLGLYVVGGLLLLTATIPPLRRARFWPLVRGVAVVVTLLVICHAIYTAAAPMAVKAAAEGRQWQSVFMPRYVGFAMPAMLVATAALLVRIPTRPLRWACVAAIVGVNLAQGTARIWAGNEPPVNDVAADVWATPTDNSVRVYADTPEAFGGPGFGSVTGFVGRYYAVAWTRGAITDDPVNFIESHPPIPRHVDLGPVAPSAVVTAARDARVRRIVVWTHVEPRQANADTVLPKLGAGWTLASERRHAVRVYWAWRELNDWHRREYVRTPSPDAK